LRRTVIARRYRGGREPTRWVAAGLAALVVVLVACGGGGTTGGGGSCADAVRVHGEWLIGHTTTALRGPLPALGARVRAEVPPCSDTNGPPDASRTTTLRRLAGVAPAIALARAAGRGTRILYLGDGYLPALPSHPLHRAFYGTDTRPVATRGLRCRGAAAQTGRIEAGAIGGGLALAQRTWTVDARTRVDVPRAHGMPRLAPGMRVRVAGVRCAGDPAVWVARRVGAA
jgi:hypothetical protein